MHDGGWQEPPRGAGGATGRILGDGAETAPELGRPLLLDVLHTCVLGPSLDPDDPGQRDPAFIAAVMPYLEAITGPYFRPEYEGAENIPRGQALLAVGNHNGGPILADLWTLLPFWFRTAGLGVPSYALVHDVAFKVKPAGNFMLRLGGLRARQANAAKVLEQGGTVLVFPGGEVDCYRSFWRRNTIDLQGRTGFVKLAFRYGVPILPFVNIGGHEVYMVLFSSRTLARWSGLESLTRVKTLPVTLGLPWGLWPTGFVPFLPLPAKFVYKAAEPLPVPCDPERAENPREVWRVYRQVTTVMQRLLDDLVHRRRWPVLG